MQFQLTHLVMTIATVFAAVAPGLENSFPGASGALGLTLTASSALLGVLSHINPSVVLSSKSAGVTSYSLVHGLMTFLTVLAAIAPRIGDVYPPLAPVMAGIVQPGASLVLGILGHITPGALIGSSALLFSPPAPLSALPASSLGGAAPSPLQ